MHHVILRDATPTINAVAVKQTRQDTEGAVQQVDACKQDLSKTSQAADRYRLF